MGLPPDELAFSLCIAIYAPLLVLGTTLYGEVPWCGSMASMRICKYLSMHKRCTHSHPPVGSWSSGAQMLNPSRRLLLLPLLSYLVSQAAASQRGRKISATIPNIYLLSSHNAVESGHSALRPKPTFF